MSTLSSKNRSLADRILEIAERLVSTNAIRARQLEEIGIDVGHLESERDEAHELISGFDSEISSGNVPDRLGDLLEKLRSAHETSSNAHDAKLDELAKLPRGWDSYDGLPPRGDCLAKARELAARLPAGHWDIVPMSNGGIVIEQHCGGLDIELMIEGALPLKASPPQHTPASFSTCTPDCPACAYYRAENGTAKAP